MCKKTNTLIRLYIQCFILLIVMYWLYLSITIDSGFLCARNKDPDQTVHSLLYTVHSNVLVQGFCVQRAIKAPDRTIDSLLHTAHTHFFTHFYLASHPV